MREGQARERVQREPLARDRRHVGQVGEVPRAPGRGERVAHRAEPREVARLLRRARASSSGGRTVLRRLESVGRSLLRRRLLRRRRRRPPSVGSLRSHVRFLLGWSSSSSSRGGGFLSPPRVRRRGERGAGLREEEAHAHGVSRVAAVDVAQRVRAVLSGEGPRGRARRFRVRFRSVAGGFFVRVFVLAAVLLRGGRSEGSGFGFVREGFLGDEDEIVVVEPRHGVLAEDEPHDVEPVDAVGSEHRADVAAPRLLLVPARDLRRALLQDERLEHVEVLVHARERPRDVAQSAAAAARRPPVAAGAGEQPVVVPREHLLLQAGEVRRLLLGRQRHGGSNARDTRGGGGERAAGAAGALAGGGRRVMRRPGSEARARTRRRARRGGTERAIGRIATGGAGRRGNVHEPRARASDERSRPTRRDDE